jgi:MoxR-like ATPase
VQVCLVAASNELPDSEELDALYDRFLLRRCVSPVSDDAVFDLLVGAEAAAGTACSSTLSPTVMTADASLASSELACKPGLDLTAIQRIAEAAETVVLPRDVLVILRGLRTYLRDEVDPPVYLSDRRLKKAAALLQTAAAAHGRGSVTVVDALLLQHVAWYACRLFHSPPSSPTPPVALIPLPLTCSGD